MNEKILKKMIGKSYYSSRPLKFRMKDSDKDGVFDLMDCEPFDYRRQGILHSIGKGIANVLPVSDKTKRKAVRYIERKEKESDEDRAYATKKKREIRVAERKAYWAAKKKATVEEAKKRAFQKSRRVKFGEGVRQTYTQIFNESPSATKERFVKQKPKKVGKPKKVPKIDVNKKVDINKVVDFGGVKYKLTKV